MPRMKTLRPWLTPLAFAATMLAITTTASADKLVVFKNGKVMLAKSVTEDAEWLKCEFEGGNFMSIQRVRVASIEESTLPEGSRGGPVNQLIDGPRGAANMPAGSGGSDDVPRAAGRGSAQMEQPPNDDEEMRRAVAEEAEARRGFGNRGRGVGQVTSPQTGLQQQQQQQFQGQPIPGLNQVVPGMQPITTPSTPITGKRRSIGRKSDRGLVTQQPGGDQNPDE